MYINREQVVKKIIEFYRKNTTYRLLATFFFTYLFLLTMKEFLVEDFIATLSVVLMVIVSLVVVMLAKKVRSRRAKFIHTSLEQIDRMRGVEFEQFLLNLFESQGYQVSGTKASGDFGVDLILEHKKARIAVQAKRYSGTVGVDAVQEVISGRGYYNCNHAMVVTNSRFTPNARELARSARVELWDRERLGKELRSMEFTLEQVQPDIVE